jgi:hypothetical protein
MNNVNKKDDFNLDSINDLESSSSSENFDEINDLGLKTKKLNNKNNILNNELNINNIDNVEEIDNLKIEELYNNNDTSGKQPSSKSEGILAKNDKSIDIDLDDDLDDLLSDELDDLLNDEINLDDANEINIDDINIDDSDLEELLITNDVKDSSSELVDDLLDGLMDDDTTEETNNNDDDLLDGLLDDGDDFTIDESLPSEKSSTIDELEEDNDLDDLFNEIENNDNNENNISEDTIVESNEDLFEDMDENDFSHKNPDSEDAEIVNLLDITEDNETDFLDNDDDDLDSILSLGDDEINNDSTNNKIVKNKDESKDIKKSKKIKKQINKKETNIMPEQKKSKESNTSPIFKYTFGIISSISLISLLTASFLFKDEITEKYNVFAGNKSADEIQLVSQTTLDKYNTDMIKLIEGLEIELTSKQKESLKPILKSLKTKDLEMRAVKSKLKSQDKTLLNLEKLTATQKQHLIKSIKLTLSVIDDAKKSTTEKSNSLYESLYSKLSSELNVSENIDFTVFEKKQAKFLNEIKKENKAIRRDLKQMQTENIKLRGKISKVEASLNNKNSNKSVLEMLDETVKIPKKSNTIEIKKIKSKSSDEPKMYNVVGIVEGIAYILPEGAKSNKDLIMYQVNDHISGYGKILRITENQIIAEKGVVRKK